MPRLDKKYEEKIESVGVTSTDRALRAEDFKWLFLSLDEPDISEFDPIARMLWERLYMVTNLLRGSDGLSFDQILEATGLLPSEAKQCVRILINLGAEIEIKASGDLKVQLFVLHN